MTTAELFPGSGPLTVRPLPSSAESVRSLIRPGASSVAGMFRFMA
jgi:hypothetical protein